MLEGVPLVLDREFSCEEDLEALGEAGIRAVVRLNTALNPTITLEKGQEERKISFQLHPGERRSYRGVWYKGRIPVQVAGYWGEKYEEPLWVVTFLEDPEKALELYRKRMKIEEQFRDLKSLLQLEKMMPKRRDILEKLLSLVMLAYGIAVLVGENLRDQAYRGRGKKMEDLLRDLRVAEGSSVDS
ncbi:MAG TPA: transposase [Spirochaetales bacterium]|nr:transposase [Spirochaetales bacterium]